MKRLAVPKKKKSRALKAATSDASAPLGLRLSAQPTVLSLIQINVVFSIPGS